MKLHLLLASTLVLPAALKALNVGLSLSLP